MEQITTTSQDLFNDAQSVLVGGVNSPVRAFKAVGDCPIFFKRGIGPYLYSEDDNRYIDYVQSWGPLVLGHCHPSVVTAIHKATELGTSFGAPSKSETDMAKLIQNFYPQLEKIRFVNSGTEAAMSAIRLARGVTNREKIIKFKGCYHGHSDSLLVEAGSGGLTLGVPNSLGVVEHLASKTIVLDYNDTDALNTVFQSEGTEIAGVIFEAVCGNMGVIPASPDFIQSLQENCKTHGALLICGEVMSGFRVAKGGACELLNIKPDITILGKVIGGGLPCGAYGASKEIMAHISPEGGVYQAGTLSGNPVVMAAGLATLTHLKQPGVFDSLVEQTTRLVEGLRAIIKSKGKLITVTQCGSMFTVFFTPVVPKKLNDVMQCDLDAFKQYYQNMLNEGVYFAPSQYEANFMSTAHQTQEIESTLAAFERSI